MASIPACVFSSLRSHPASRRIAVNQHGVAYGIIEAGRKMNELGVKGTIISTASVFGFLASPGTFAYHATKGAVIFILTAHCKSSIR